MINIKQEKGITLMILVVTIIVLLILASVTVKLTLGDGGILGEVKESTNEWEKLTEKEQSDLSKLAQEMRKARNGIYNETSGNQTGSNETSGGGTGEATEGIGSITGNETKNTDTTDKEGNRVVVPAGFKVVNPEATVNDGIVVEDVNGNNSDTCRKSVCMDSLRNRNRRK